MFDFFKKKEPLLFTLDITLDHLQDDSASAKATRVKVKPDGSVYFGSRKIGAVAAPLWNYIRQFDTPKELRRVTPLVFQVDAYGEVDRRLICESPVGDPYTYRCGTTIGWPYMMPHTEYHCDLIDKEDHLDIQVAGTKIGELAEVPERKRLGKLRSMLKSGFQATAKIAPQNTYCELFLNLRKV